METRKGDAYHDQGGGHVSPDILEAGIEVRSKRTGESRTKIAREALEEAKTKGPDYIPAIKQAVRNIISRLRSGN
jgi:hypothetical protein